VEVGVTVMIASCGKLTPKCISSVEQDLSDRGRAHESITGYSFLLLAANVEMYRIVLLLN